MSHARFDELRERLLRAGIAPRHVRRYIAELSDHFDDLLREETANGLERAEAENAARARIGNDDALAAVVLGRPELRSLSAKYPWAVFGFGPILMLAAAVAALVSIEAALILSRVPVPPALRPSGRLLLDSLNWLAVYAAPLFVAALLCTIALKQRMKVGWLLCGLAVICVVGSGHNIGVHWSTTPAQPSEFYAQYLGPRYSQAMIMACALRAAMNAVLVSAAYLLWLRPRLSILQ